MSCDVTLSHTPFCIISPRKRKEKKRNINNNLAVLPSHDNMLFVRKADLLSTFNIV